MLDDARTRLAPAMRTRMTAERNVVATQAARLDALSPLAILARGYSVTLAKGHAVVDAAQMKPGDAITVRVHRGEIDATVTGIRKP
jgi:exodeoxyribonuclease VII large subunit